MDFLKDVLSSILSLGGIFTLFYIGGYCIEAGKQKLKSRKSTTKAFSVSFSFISEGQGRGEGDHQFTVTGNSPLLNLKAAKEIIRESILKRSYKLKEGSDVIIHSVSEIAL